MRAEEVRFDAEDDAGHGVVHVLNALLFIGMWGLTLWLYRELPERIPGHIGTSGVTRWDSRESGTWFLLPILATAQLPIMYALAAAAASSPQMINTPQKKRLLALSREGQRYALRPLRAFMAGMAAWLLVLTIWIQLSFYRVAVAAQTGNPGPGGMLTGIIVLTAVPILLTVWLSRAVRRRIEAWESRDGEAAL